MQHMSPAVTTSRWPPEHNTFRDVPLSVCHKQHPPPPLSKIHSINLNWQLAPIFFIYYWALSGRKITCFIKQQQQKSVCVLI